MTRRQNRMVAVGGLVVGLALAAWLGFTAMSKNLMYFYTPTDVVSGKAPAHAKMRLGGLVERGSVSRGDGLLVNFTLADCAQKVGVKYEGILPDLFREGQGIVASGHVENGTFIASEVLAKHDENYMPPELADSLKTDTGHSCMPFKPVTQPQAAADVPRHAQRGEGGTEHGVIGGVRGVGKPVTAAAS